MRGAHAERNDHDIRGAAFGEPERREIVLGCQREVRQINEQSFAMSFSAVAMAAA
jgi:hypothetical protein